MSDPFKKARDDDRETGVDLVEAAFAGGQITQPDRDLRVDRLRRAETVGEVEMLVQDLRRHEAPGVSRLAPLAPQPPAAAGPLAPQPPASVASLAPQPPASVAPLAPQPPAAAAPLAPRPPPAPGVSRLASLAPQPPARVVRWVLLAVVGFGAVPLAIFSAVEEDGQRPGAVEVAEVRDLTTPAGWDGLVAAVEDRTGSRTVFNATVYPGYAVVEVPVGDQGQRSHGYYFDGEWQDWTGRGTAEEERFDLQRIDGAVVKRLVRRVRSRIEDPTSWYVLVNPGRAEGVCLSAYAINDFSETAYLDARCDGEIAFSYVSE